MKKIITSILVISLFLTASIVSVNAFDKGELIGESQSSDPPMPFADIYVDDDNTEGPWYGTLEHPYHNISSAVDAANPGDTIFVFNGFYSENSIYFYKPVKLIGEDKYNTIINRPSYQVFDVDGFELRNFSLISSLPAIGLWGSSNCTISENLFLQTTDGIVVSNSSNCIVSNNILKNTSGDGITLRARANNNNIKNNYIDGSGKGYNGICIQHCSGDNFVANNTISNFKGSGIYLTDDCNRTIIIDNTINNTHHAISLRFSSNLTASRNKITNSSEGIMSWNNDDVIISDNVIKNSDYRGIMVLFGKTDDFARNILISGNIIENSKYYGIDLDAVADSVITNNTITEIYGCNILPGYGVYVGAFAKNIILSYNNIKSCVYGIFLDESWYPPGPMITCKNNIISYNDFGAVLYGLQFYNVITKNEIRNNDVGVALYGYIKEGQIRAPFQNWIVGNNISENTNCGVYATELTSSNHIYYNNFIDNNQNAYDTGINTWYKYKLLGQNLGNYWSDYTEKYPNAEPLNGVWNTPYNIPPYPLRNKDRYPSVAPFDFDNIDVSEFVTNELTKQSNSQTITEISDTTMESTTSSTIKTK
jgi:parallel beta-helix repeat protein